MFFSQFCRQVIKMRQFIIKFFHATIFALCSFLNKRINHKQDKILFYTDLGFRDNAKALYDYLIENEFNKKYKIVCATNDYAKFVQTQPQNVTFKKKWNGFVDYFSAGYVFYCFGRIPILPGKNQKVVQLWHGTPFKAKSKDFEAKNDSEKLFFTHVVASSKHLIPVLSYTFSFPEDKIIVCGQPRNDNLFKSSPYQFGNYAKLILWAPTFRDSKEMGKETQKKAPLIPIFGLEHLQELNSFLGERKLKMIIKLHPVQDITEYNLVEMENLIFLSHAEFTKREMDLYVLAGQCDALITDYSSIFSDFLLLNRPLAFTEDDIDDYQNTRGFSVQNINDYRAGFHIKTKQDFYQFLDDLSHDKDSYEQEREQANKLLNDYRDNKSCARVLNAVGLQ